MASSKMIVGKDAVSRIARRLEEEEQKEWRERSLKGKGYPPTSTWTRLTLRSAGARVLRAWRCWRTWEWTRRVSGRFWW